MAARTGKTGFSCLIDPDQELDGGKEWCEFRAASDGKTVVLLFDVDSKSQNFSYNSLT